MKNLLLMILMLVSFSTLAQIQTFRTYYDPLTQTKLHEEWTAKQVPNRARGVKHGIYKEFDTEGNLIREMQYQNGKQDGYSRIYYFVPDYGEKECYGKLIGDYNFKAGKKHGMQKDYDCLNGQLILRNESEFIDGQVVSEKTFHRDGAKESEHRYNGINREWNQEGNLIAEYALANGVEEGMYTIYHANGQVKLKGIMSNGTYSGNWVSYNEDGSLLAEFTKEEGIHYFTSIKSYSMGGVLREETTYNGNLHFSTVYDSVTGRKLYEEYRNYRDNVDYFPAQERKDYYPDGSLKNKIQYADRGEMISVEVMDRTGARIGGGSFDRYADPMGTWIIFRRESGEWTWDPEIASLKYDIEFVNRKGDARVYDMTDVLLGSGNIEHYQRGLNLREIGVWTYLFPNGSEKEVGEYSAGSKTGEWKLHKDDGTLQSVQVWSYGTLKGKKTLEEINAEKFETLKRMLVLSYSNFETQNSNSNVQFYRYRARNTDRYIIFEKGLTLINHYLEKVDECIELACLEQLQSKFDAVDSAMKVYQKTDPGSLIIKLNLAKKIEKIETLLVE